MSLKLCDDIASASLAALLFLSPTSKARKHKLHIPSLGQQKRLIEALENPRDFLMLCKKSDASRNFATVFLVLLLPTAVWLSTVWYIIYIVAKHRSIG